MMMMTAGVEKLHFRLVLLGSLGTGKTSILNRFLFKKFETKYKPTVEDLFSEQYDLGSIVIKIDFLDTSGSMQFPAMRRLSLTTGSAFLIVYAVDDENSYEVLKMCVQELRELRPDFQEIPLVFAGNKCDIPRERRKVLKEVVSNYVHYELPRLRAKVIECSCRDNINIDNIFRAYLSLAKVTRSSASLRPVGTGSSGQPATPTGGDGSTVPKFQFSASDSSGGRQGQAQADTNQERSSAIDGPAPPTSPTDKQPPPTPLEHTSRRSSSIKVILGVRKSCDASIVSPRRSTLFGLAQTGATGAAAVAGSGRASAASTTPPPPPLVGSQAGQQQPAAAAAAAAAAADDQEFNLEMALQSKLSVNERPKPRSRSLIWRPSRTKSKRNSAAAATANNECRVT